MHPAFSVIFFTVTSGIGYGLLAFAGLLAPLGLISSDTIFGSILIVFSLALITAGLLSSTLHLRHPERAWRALSQWRSSWLSREGIAALLTYGPALSFAIVWIYMSDVQNSWGIWGYVTASLSMITVFFTSKIYASLKSIPQWHHPLVSPVYLSFSITSGAMWLLALSAIVDKESPLLVYIALICLIVSAVLKTVYWRSIDQQQPTSDMGTATGLGSIGTVRQLEAPHSADNWVMREMGYVIGRKHAKKLRRIAALFGFALPLFGLILMSFDMGPTTFIALCSAVFLTLGVAVERWLFFAEARHVVGLFYGRHTD